MMKKILPFICLLGLAIFYGWNELVADTSPLPQAPVVEEVQRPVYLVYVTGAVHSPGLYSFSEVVRVGDAVHAAGDALPYADASAVNYASPIEDGMQIHLPYNLEGVPQAAEDGKVNINEADEQALTGLPGIGPAMAKKIIEYRTSHGAFSDVEELQNVKGIGMAKFEKIKDKVST